MSPQMLLGPVLVFLAVFAAARLVMAWFNRSSEQPERALGGLVGGLQDAASLDMDTRRDALPWLSRRMAGTDLQRQMQLSLIRAGIVWRPSEWLALMAALIVVGSTAGYLLRGLPGAVLGVLLFGLVPLAIISIKQGARKRALMLQLAPGMDLICASLRAGHSFSHALGTVAEQMPPPLSIEATRVIEELGLGLSLEQALGRMITRTDQPDVELMCTAVQIQSRTGGSLANVLNSMGAVIRERVRLQGEINAVTAEGRLSALILIAMPIIMAVALNTMNPGWLTPLFVTLVGKVILGLGGLAYLTGIVVLHKMLQIDI